MTSNEKESSDKSRHFKRIDRLTSRLAQLNNLQLSEVERLVNKLEMYSGLPIQQVFEKCSSGTARDWPHSPMHRLNGKGTFIVTAGTLAKEHFFRNEERLSLLEAQLLSKAKEYNWQLEAWAVFSNHYHFVAHSMEDAKTLKPFLTHLHADTAREINRLDKTNSRQIWFNFWDTELTYEKSYLARLNYVHQNAVKHRLVPVANQYRWCSAAWLERTAKPSQVKTIYSFKTDRVNIMDDFDVLGVR